MMQSFCSTSNDNKQATTVNKQFTSIFHLSEFEKGLCIYIYIYIYVCVCVNQLNSDTGD